MATRFGWLPRGQWQTVQPGTVWDGFWPNKHHRRCDRLRCRLSRCVWVPSQQQRPFRSRRCGRALTHWQVAKSLTCTSPGTEASCLASARCQRDVSSPTLPCCRLARKCSSTSVPCRRSPVLAPGTLHRAPVTPSRGTAPSALTRRHSQPRTRMAHLVGTSQAPDGRYLYRLSFRILKLPY